MKKKNLWINYLQIEIRVKNSKILQKWKMARTLSIFLCKSIYIGGAK